MLPRLQYAFRTIPKLRKFLHLGFHLSMDAFRGRHVDFSIDRFTIIKHSHVRFLDSAVGSCDFLQKSSQDSDTDAEYGWT